MTSPLLPTRKPLDFAAHTRAACDPETLAGAGRIVNDVLANGEPAVRRWAEELGDLSPGDPLLIDARACRVALDSLPAADRRVLERVHGRITRFAEAQRATLGDLDTPIVAGRAGHTLAPVAAAGCYAPGGRYPLPSSVLMTAATARVAAVPQVVVASPRPTPVTLAAAARGCLSLYRPDGRCATESLI